MKVPTFTRRPRFYVGASPREVLSSWNTIEEARDCIERLRDHAPEDYERVIGIYETGPQIGHYGGKEYVFHAKRLKPIPRHPGGMRRGSKVYVIVQYDQGFHFRLVSETVWVKFQNTMKGLGAIIDQMFPAQEEDISEEPEVLEHTRWFAHLHHLLEYVEQNQMSIVTSWEQVGP